MPTHEFAKKSPEARAESIRPAEAFTYTVCPWDPTIGKCRLTVRHHDAKCDVKAMEANDLMLSSVGLWWARVVAALPDLDMKMMDTHDPDHHWWSYQQDMAALVEVVARSGTSKTAELQQSAALALAHWTDEIARMSHDTFLLSLAWERDLKRRGVRVALLHWLSSWSAQQQGKTLRSTMLKHPDAYVPLVCPLSAAAWGTELQARRERLSFPSVLTRVGYRELEINKAPRSGVPLWLQLVSYDTLETGPADFVTDLEKLSVVRDARSPSVAPIRMMALDLAIPDLVANTMRAATTAQTVEGAAKSLWLGCPAGQQVQLRTSLQGLMAAVEENYGSAQLEGQRHAKLEKLTPLVQSLEHTSFTWSTAACTVAGRCAAFIPNDSDARALLFSVRDCASYRVAMSHVCEKVTTSAPWAASQKPRCNHRTSRSPPHTRGLTKGIYTALIIASGLQPPLCVVVWHCLVQDSCPGP